MLVFNDKSIKNKRFAWDFKNCQIATDDEMAFLVVTLVWMPPQTCMLTI